MYNKATHILQCSFTNMGDEGTIAMAAAVIGHPTLRELHLQGNSIGNREYYHKSLYLHSMAEGNLHDVLSQEVRTRLQA